MTRIAIPSFSVVRVVWLEAVRGYLFKGAAFSCLLALLATGLVDSLALTEAHQTRVAVSALLARFALVFALIAFVAFGLSREFSDRQVTFALAAPLSRGLWLCSRYLGLLGISLVLALMGTLIQLPSAAAIDSIFWGATLFAELALVSAFALFTGLAFSQGSAALILTVGFYILSRLYADLLLMIQGPYGQPDSWLATMMQTFGWLLPRIDQLTQTAWLVEGATSFSNVAFLITQTFVFALLLLAAAWVDFSRRIF
jgi:ABC-type transport system involved in multi-copper enzyme maturation permease subunit